jgi:hypothetical protein
MGCRDCRVDRAAQPQKAAQPRKTGYSLFRVVVLPKDADDDPHRTVAGLHALAETSIRPTGATHSPPPEPTRWKVSAFRPTRRAGQFWQRMALSGLPQRCPERETGQRSPLQARPVLPRRRRNPCWGKVHLAPVLQTALETARAAAHARRAHAARRGGHVRCAWHCVAERRACCAGRTRRHRVCHHYATTTRSRPASLAR